MKFGGEVVGSENLYVHIYQLRKKIEEIPSEGEGYWTNNHGQEVGLLSTPYHYGFKQVSSDGKSYRAVGETTWKGVYHYSRAQLVGRINGYVYADSGREWDVDYTKAISPWRTKDYRAKTYYGR
jgi:hypothetical protein